MSTEILRPDAAGAYCNLPRETGSPCPTHFQNVDEVSTDEDSTLVQNDTAVEQKDAYNIGSSSIPGGSVINSVTVYFRFRSVDVGDAYATPGLRLSASETLGTEIPHTGTGYTTYNEALARPGGGNWAVADLADLEVIIGLKAGTGLNYGNCTQIYVQIDYSLAVVGGSPASLLMAQGIL